MRQKFPPNGWHLYQATWRNTPHYILKTVVAESLDTLHLSTKMHGVTAQKTVISFICSSVVLRRSWSFSQFYNQCSANTGQEQEHLHYKLHACSARCQHMSYTQQNLRVCFHWTTTRVDTQHSWQPISVVTGPSHSRLLGEFNVYTCRQIIIFHCRFPFLHPHGRQFAFPSNAK